MSSIYARKGAQLRQFYTWVVPVGGVYKQKRFYSYASAMDAFNKAKRSPQVQAAGMFDAWNDQDYASFTAPKLRVVKKRRSIGSYYSNWQDSPAGKAWLRSSRNFDNR